MQKIITLFIVALFSMQLVSAQKTDTSIYHSPQDLHNFYWQKHKTNQIIGWSCVGGGTAMVIGGFAINLKTGIFSNSKKGLWLSDLGLVTALASIPFFISSGKNKRKARLALKAQSISFGNNTRNQLKYKAVVLTISL